MKLSRSADSRQREIELSEADRAPVPCAFGSPSWQFPSLDDFGIVRARNLPAEWLGVPSGAQEFEAP